MSYVKFIADYPILEDYFQQFPKHLMEVALQVVIKNLNDQTEL